MSKERVFEGGLLVDFNKLIPKVIRLGANGDKGALKDSFELIKALELEGSNYYTNSKGKNGRRVYNDKNFAKAHELSKKFRAACVDCLQKYKGGNEALELYRSSLLFDAPYDFDSFMLFCEFEREEKRQFYLPRRKQLKVVADALQLLADDKLDLLAVSMPPGVGKSTTAIFFLCWLAGRNPELQILGGSHSNSFLRGVYDECLRILDPNGEYLWWQVFPGVQVVNTNAKDMRIDLGRKKRFETLEFSSIGSGNAGKVRATNLLYCDDLVEGIEQAMSIERMDKLWQAYTTDLRQRKQGNVVKELHIATRWSVHDVIGRLEDAYNDDPRAKFIRMPALDEEDHSNFNYPYGLGYTDEALHEQRAIMDDVSWRALYMNEPIEREGLLYSEDELRRYFTLPDRDPDAIIGVCDTKTTGSDDCCLPIAYQYGMDFYIEDVLCENYSPDIVEDNIVLLLCKQNPQLVQFESNVAGGKLAQVVQQRIKEKGCKTKITTKWTQANKETKIIVNSPFVKQHFLFKDNSVIQGGEYKEYRAMIKKLCSYTLLGGKKQHDDVPDAMSQLALFVQGMAVQTAQVINRPF